MAELGFPELGFPELRNQTLRPQDIKSSQAEDPYAGDLYAEAFFPGKPAEEPPKDSAPLKPSYIYLVQTTFKTTLPLSEAITQLEAAFPRVSFDWTASSEHPCVYECTAVRLRGLVELEICIFYDGANHLVEIRHLSGCRYAFSEAASDLAEQLKVDWIGGSAAFRMPFAPPPLPAGVALEPPPGFTGKILTPKQYAAQACEPVLSLLGQESPHFMQLQGARAAGGFAAGDTEGMLFAEGCPGIPIAIRLIEIIQNEQALNPPDTNTIITIICALANIIRLPRVCPRLVSNPNLIKIANEAIKNEEYHAKREGIQIAFLLASRKIDMGPDIKGLLELYVKQPVKDVSAMKFAQDALKLLE